MSNLNTVDYVILGLLVLGGISGAIKGFLEELSQKFGLILGLIASLMFTRSLTPIVADKLGIEIAWVNTGISYCLIFIAGYLLMKIIGSLLQVIFKSANVGFIDVILGFCLGVFELVILTSIVINLLEHQNLFNVQSYIDNSFICEKYFAPFYDWMLETVKKVI